MKIELLCFGILQSNCYLIVSEDEALIVDPGAPIFDIELMLKKRNLNIKGILLTHGHFDHILSAGELSRKYKIPVYIHKDDSEMTNDGDKNAYTMFTGMKFKGFEADVLLSDGDVIPFGENEKIEVLQTKGHSRGSVCYKVNDSLITGDTLFSMGVGRCDLYGGSEKDMKESLEKLSALPKDMKIYPGHGDMGILSRALDSVMF